MIPNKNTIGKVNQIITDDETGYKYICSSVSETFTDKGSYFTYEWKKIYDETSTIIPTKVSELENDEGYLTSIPSEYITETELNKKGYLTSIPPEYIEKGYLTNTDLSLGVHSDGGIYLFVNGEPVGLGVFISNVEINVSDGYVTDDNIIMLSDNIPSGTYSMKYKNEDGTYSLIGNFEI